MVEILLCCAVPFLVFVVIAAAAFSYRLGYEIGSTAGLQIGRYICETGQEPTEEQVKGYVKEAARDVGGRIGKQTVRRNDG